MKATSLWKDTFPPAHSFPSLSNIIQADVAIVGAGITGITAAYLLSRAGKKVVVLEKGLVGSGETSHTTAFLSYVADEDLSVLSKTFDEETAVKSWKSLQFAIDTIEQIIRTEHIDCDFERVPLYFYPHGKEGEKTLQEEYEIAARHYFPIAWEEKMNGLNIQKTMKVNNNAKFHPLKYLSALAQKATEHGALIFENSEVVSYSSEEKPTIETEQGKVQAEAVFIATHNPNNLAFEAHTRLIPYQTYVIAAEIPKNSIEHSLFIDTDDPYHYIRVDAGETKDILILGGEDHETGQDVETEKQYHKLEEYLQKILSSGEYTLQYQWSGQVIETVDGLPFIGELMLNNKPIYIGTGYAGDGMTYGTLAAVINTDLILGKKNEWAKMYSTKRFRGVKEFARWNFNFVKELVKGRLEIPEGDVASIEPNSGRVFEIDGQKVAVFKRHDGKVFRLSPVCTHLGCIVRWNNEAKTWDCPCHGSRYESEGNVLTGPAKKPLKNLE